MKKFNPNKNIIITLILVIVVVSIVSLTAANRANSGKTNIVQSFVNDTVSLVDRALTFPVKSVSSVVSSVNTLFDTYDENQRLKEKIDSYNDLVLQKNNLEEENKSLKEELGLNETLRSYDRVSGTVISRSPDMWQDFLIVDRGSNDGIEPNMAVMSQKGLIGRIIEVNASTSKVELLTSKNQSSNHFPVKIDSGTGNSYGLLSGYEDKDNMLVISQVVGDLEIKKGDVVQTSGLGQNSPADLPVGVVEKITQDSFGLDREVYIKPYADMYGISTVTIIKRLAGSGE